MNQTQTKSIAKYFALLATIIISQANGYAANVTKLDTTSLVTNSVNWSGGSGASGSVTTNDIGSFGVTPQAATLAALTLQNTNTSLGGLIFSNSLAGPVTIVSGGTLTLGASGIDMSAANQNVYANCTLAVSLSQTWNIGTGVTLTNGSLNGWSGPVLTKAGAGSLIVNNVSAQSGGSGEGFLVTGGSVTASSILIGRNSSSGAYGAPSAIGVPAAQATTTGFYVGSSANTVTVSGSLTIGTQNSAASGRQDGGTVALSGAFVLGKTSNTRTTAFQMTAGTFTNSDTVVGLQIAPNNGASVNTAVAYFTGGTATFQKIGFGALVDTVGGNGYLTLAGGTLYVGAGGIVKSNNIAAYAANICLNSGTLGAAANWSSSLPITLNGPVIIQAADSSGVGRNITLNGAITNISGLGQLTKTGAGILTLAGNNIYPSNTIVNAGELVGVTGGSISNNFAFIVAAGATNGVQLASAGGQWTATNMIVTNASVMDFNFNGFAPSTTVAPLVVLGNLNMTNAVSFLFRGATFGVGSYPLVKYTAFAGSVTNYTGIMPNRAAGYISNDVATTKTIYLVITNASAEPLTWTAATSTTWDTATVNWVDKFGNASSYQDPNIDQVVFDDTATGTSPLTVTLNSTVTPRSITANLTNKNYTISGTGGVITGSGNLVKAGVGQLTLTPSSAWTYSGGVTNAGGTIVMGNVLANNSACGTGPVTFNGGTLQLFENGASNESGPHTNAWVVPTGQTGTVLAVQRIGFSSAFSSPLTGGGTFNFNANGVRTVPSGDWTGFTGQVNIGSRSGTATLQWNTTKGIPNALVNLTNVTFTTWVTAQVIPIGALMGTNATLTAGSGGAAGSATYVIGGANLSSIYDGTITSATTIRKVGTGTWTLTGANTHTGATIVSNGTLIVNGSISSSAVTNYSGTTLGGIGTFSAAVDLEAGSTLAAGGVGSVGNLTFNGSLTLNGITNSVDVNGASIDTVTVGSGATLNLNSGVVKLNITALPADGSYTLIDHTGATVNGTVANLSLSPTTFGGSSLSLADNGNQIQLVISTVGTNALTWTTTGVAANNYWDIGSSINWTNNVGVDMEAFQNGDTVTFDDSGAANSPVDVRSAVSPNGVVVNATADYVFANSTSFGQISGGLTNGFVKSGSGKLTMLTKNNFTGPTTINGGTVQVGDGSTPNTAISGGSVTNNALLIFNQSDNSSISGDLTGTGSLVKQGAGILTIQGNATFSGTNLIDTGTLQLGSGGATAITTNQFVLANGGTVTLNRAGNYGFTNTVTGNGSVVFAGTATNLLGGAQTYLQNTYVKGGLVKLQANNVIPYATSVAGSTGWLILDGGASAAGTFDLNGFNQTVNALSGLTGTVLGQITNSASGTGTNVLTINSIADTGFAGKILENSGGAKIALVKDGTGTQFLTGANAFSGGITINSGTLAISQAASVGTSMITLMGGALSNTVNVVSLSAKNLTVPTGQSGVLAMQPVEQMPALYGGGTLNANMTATQAGHNSNTYGDTPSACANFTGTLNCTGVVASANMNLYFNGGPFDGHLENATVNLDSLALYAVVSSGGNTAQFGSLNVNANASIGGANYPNNQAAILTLQIGALGGSSDIEGPITSYSGITKVGAGSLLLNGTDSYTGNTTINAGSVVVGASSFMSSSPVITVAAGATLDVSSASSISLGGTAPQTLNGSGTVVGSVSAANSALQPGGTGAVGTLTIATGGSATGDLTLGGNTTNTFDIALTGANDLIALGGSLNVSGSLNIININAINAYINPGTYTLMNYAGSSLTPNSDVTSSFTLAGSILQFRNYYLTNTGVALQLVVGSGNSLVWTGDGSANKWDVTNSINWSGPSAFYQLDNVTFDNSSTNQTVNLTLSLAPAAITVNSDSNYVFTSTGKITGPTGITKSGTKVLTISNSGGNDYTGAVTINNGVLKAGSATALGSTNGATYVTNSGALDIGGQNLGAEPVVVSGSGLSGAGAIQNSGATALNALQFVTLAGDTTFGGTNRWDIRTNALGAFLQGNSHNLTKTGANDTYLVNVGNANLNNVTIAQGRIGLQNNTVLGSSGTLTLFAGVGLDLWDTTVTNTKSINLTNATISSSSNTNVYGGAITLNGTGTFTATTALQLTGALSGSGAVLKNGAALLTLTGSSTYTGNTTISNGVLALAGSASIANSANVDVTAGAQLDVSGLSGSLITLGSSQTLKGVGSVKGSVAVPAGSTIAPGESAVGTLTVSNNVTLGGTNAQIVNSTGTSSKLVVGGTLNYNGGTLVISNAGPAYAVGNTFTIFSAGTYSGSFAAISPSTPGAGLAWNTNALATSGTLSVVTGGPSGPGYITNSISGTTLTLTWPAGQGWRLVSQTNDISTGLTTNWFTVPGVTDGSATITVDPSKPTVFYELVNP